MERTSFKVLFYLKKQRKTAGGQYPIYLRFTLNRERAEFSIKRRVLLEDWDQSRGYSNRRSKDAIQLNEYLDQCRLKAFQCHKDLISEDLAVSAQSLKDRYLGRDVSANDLLTVCEEYLTIVDERTKVDISNDTYGHYELCFRQLTEFFKYTGKRRDTKIKDVTLKLIKDFEHYLRTVKGLGSNTAIKRLKTLRTVFKYAYANEYIKRDPFVNLPLREKYVHRGYLTEEELRIICNKELHTNRLREVRDVFLFSCYTSLPYSDVLSLETKHIETREDGQKWIIKQRIKTGAMLRIPLLSEAQKLLINYTNHPDIVNSNKLLPVKSNQKMNAYLKEIAAICGIEKRLTSHLGRHTFATIALANGVSLEVLQTILGHSSLEFTKIYAVMLSSRVDREMKEFQSRNIFGSKSGNSSNISPHLRVV
jgi:site-specific recombinase XerD